MATNKKVNKGKQQHTEPQKASPDARGNAKAGTKKSQNSKKSHKATGSWSFLSKLNILLLLTVICLSCRALYLYSEGDMSEVGLARARGRLAEGVDTLTARVVAVASLGWGWAAAHAHSLDQKLTEAQPAYWLPVKERAGKVASVVGHYGGIAGERTLMLTALGVRKSWEAAEAGWVAAEPYVNATVTAVYPYYNATKTAVYPYYNATVTAAEPYAVAAWRTAAERGSAVKAGVLAGAARLREDAGPTLARGAAGAQKAVGDAWEAVQRDGPVYAAKVWELSCRAGCALREAVVSAWEVARTEGPKYARAASDRVSAMVNSLTGESAGEQPQPQKARASTKL